jgi:type I site-specific restriction endonuclease
VWLEFLPQFVHIFAGFEPVENMVEDVRRLVQEAGLDEVRVEHVKELLDSHGQQHSNADLKELAKELSQQRKEEKEKDKDPPLKCTKTIDLQRILSATETLTDELCDTDHDWERSAKVKRSKMISIGPSSEIPKGRNT